MKLSFREEELAFEADVVQFIDEHWPATARAARTNAEMARRWFDALVAKGWSVPLWPASIGGMDWTPTQKFIWERALALAETPIWDPCGVALAGPLIGNFGNRRQQARWLPPIRALQARWCHGFASRDPNAIAVSAVRRGGGTFVSGRIERTVGAADGDYLMSLVRTDPEQEGPEQGAGAEVSLVVVDLQRAGVTVDDATILLDEVSIEARDLIGEPHRGWFYATAVLDHERAAVQRVTAARIQLEKLKEVMRRTPDGEGRTLDQDEDVGRKVATAEVTLTSLEALELRVLSDLADGNTPGPEALALQIKGGELLMRVGELIVEALGYYAMPYPDEHLLHNEGPVGPDYALPAIQGMLFDRSWSAFSPDPERARDRVAQLILGPEGS